MILKLMLFIPFYCIGYVCGYIGRIFYVGFRKGYIRECIHAYSKMIDGYDKELESTLLKEECDA